MGKGSELPSEYTIDVDNSADVVTAALEVVLDVEVVIGVGGRVDVHGTQVHVAAAHVDKSVKLSKSLGEKKNTPNCQSSYQFVSILS